MSELRTWLITGATRGLGVAIARAALAAGERVVVTGRRRDALVAAFGEDSDRVLSLTLDVADLDAAGPVVEGHVQRRKGLDGQQAQGLGPEEGAERNINDRRRE